MTSKRKILRFVAIPALALLAAGCSGINVRHTVSPASFFLPGLLKADPAPATNDVTLPETPVAQQVASVR